MFQPIREIIMEHIRQGKRIVPWKFIRSWRGQGKMRVCGEYFVAPASCVWDVTVQKVVTLCLVDLRELLKELNLGEKMPLGRNKAGDFFFPHSHQKYCNTNELIINLTDPEYAGGPFKLRLTYLRREIRRIKKDIAALKERLAHLRERFEQAEVSEELMAIAGDIDTTDNLLMAAESTLVIYEMEFERLGGDEMLEELLKSDGEEDVLESDAL